MATKAPSAKRVQIDKANTIIIAAIAISSFIVVFSLVASKALLSQRSYQARVISKKEKARDQLKSNIAAGQDLVNSYKTFVGTSQNVLGGDPNGTGDKDGDNAKIILDALPSKYDFPALATSLDKILTQNKVKINTINGSDDELAQQNQTSSADPQPVDMPFTVNVTGNFNDIRHLIDVFELSIRPFNITTLTLSGSDRNLQANIEAKTYYQPGKDVSITTEVVK